MAFTVFTDDPAVRELGDVITIGDLDLAGAADHSHRTSEVLSRSDGEGENPEEADGEDDDEDDPEDDPEEEGDDTDSERS